MLYIYILRDLKICVFETRMLLREQTSPEEQYLCH